MSGVASIEIDLPKFDRNFWDGKFQFTRIGAGDIGGKARGLLAIKDLLVPSADSTCIVDVPTLAVIATQSFDQFLEQNALRDLPFSELTDQRIAMAFQKADLPAELVGDLRALSVEVKTPLAIRSSSVLEDRLERPFAGVYETKMLPNNALDADTRSHRLAEAVKLVYASTFFSGARKYIRTTGHDPHQEKMAVIIQEVVGLRHGERFYPNISGVGRSYNFYPFGPATPQDRFASLAVGLGKTIVDDGTSWNYSPAHPHVAPPFKTRSELFEQTQTRFWAVNMGRVPTYDPVSETEFLVHATLKDAEEDGVLNLLASTFDADNDRLSPGLNVRGPRVLNFAPILQFGVAPVNEAIVRMLEMAERATNDKVEIEFAITIDRRRPSGKQIRIGLLQVRPIAISHENVGLGPEDLEGPDVIVSSDRVLGNGSTVGIHDVVYVKAETFSSHDTKAIAEELGTINEQLRSADRPYVLIGFGRWGTTDPTSGIPVEWSQISGARAIVETTLPSLAAELSQASHFFHNLTSFHAAYFMLQHDGPFKIDWDWLARQDLCTDGPFVRHVRTSTPMTIRVDGRSGRGVILCGEANAGTAQ